MLLLAILLPCVSFLLRGKILSFVVCLILQLTLIGWLPAAIWAVVDLQNKRAERRTSRIVRSMKNR
ncbi:YqaE/Pmp3 family membrane protein [Flavitalea flava]